MSAICLESALRVHLAHRNVHCAIRLMARAMVHQTIAAIRAARIL